MMKSDSLLSQILQGLRDMCYILIKEMRSVVTDEGALIFMVLVPLGYPLLYSWIYTNEVVHDVPVAVVDYSQSATSREFIRMIDASPDTRVAYFCADMDEARQRMAKQDVHGILYFPKNFQTKLYRGEQATASVYCDMSLMLNYKGIYKTAVAVSSLINSGIQAHNGGGFTNRDDEVTTSPINIEEVPIFNSTGGYGNFLIPAVLILILHQTMLLGVGLLAGTARENNRYRDLVPVSKHHRGIYRIVMGKGLCYFLIYMVMAAYVLMVVPQLFHYDAFEDAFTLFAFMVPYILDISFFAIMLSCLVRYRENVLLLVIFTSVPLLFMSGASWPDSNIPGIWQGLSILFPSTWGIKCFQRICLESASLKELGIDYYALWIQTAVYFIGACLVYRYQLIMTREHAQRNLEEIKSQIKSAIAQVKNKQ